MNKEKVLSKTKLDFKGGGRKQGKASIVISDPSYLSMDRPDLVYTRTFDDISLVDTEVHLLEMESTYGSITFKNIEMIIFLKYPSVKIGEVTNENFRVNWPVKEIKKEDKLLGCDTAEFLLDFNGNYNVISTGADGFYGLANDFYTSDGNWLATNISLTLPEHINLNDAIMHAKYWFK